MGGDPMLDQVGAVLAAALAEYAGDASVARQLAQIRRRADEPLRVALAGALKAGKSTLLNALVGQVIAPTDATECTKVNTWYRNGPAPAVTAWLGSGGPVNVGVRRAGGLLAFDLGGHGADEVDRIEVAWPSASLRLATLVDTPGTSSMSREVSARTLRLLAPPEGASGADSVLYLLRTLNATDIQTLRTISEHVGGDSGPLGVVGVLARADEVGAGRPDAMRAARVVADRYADELGRLGLCHTVIPVAGLLALAAATLRHSDYQQLAALAGTPDTTLGRGMLSVDRFAADGNGLPGTGAGRAELVRKFGLFGVRTAVGLLREGVEGSPALAAELLRVSGLEEVRTAVATQFGQRADQLRAHSALVALGAVLEQAGGPGAGPLGERVAELLADGHAFAELRLLARLRSTPTGLVAAERARMELLVGGLGVDPAVRLGLPPTAGGAEVRAAALEAVRWWRARAVHPLNSPFAEQACEVAARSAEAIVVSAGGG